VALFHPVGRILRGLLRPLDPRPWLRRVREPLGLLANLGGARVKRLGLTLLGGREARRQERDAFPGADWLARLSAERAQRGPDFFPRWLAGRPGRVVELMCHPGHPDPTVAGRDELREQRVQEHARLRDPGFLLACRQAGFVLRRPTALTNTLRVRHVA